MLFSRETKKEGNILEIYKYITYDIKTYYNIKLLGIYFMKTYSFTGKFLDLCFKNSNTYNIRFNLNSWLS